MLVVVLVLENPNGLQSDENDSQTSEFGFKEPDCADPFYLQ